jgi:hypothetical protein
MTGFSLFLTVEAVSNSFPSQYRLQTEGRQPNIQKAVIQIA